MFFNEIYVIKFDETIKRGGTVIEGMEVNSLF